MRKALMLLAVTLGLASCATTSSLYYWGGSSSGKATLYENMAYQAYDKQTPEVTCKLLSMYNQIINKPGGTRGVVAPGICAEYGYLLLQPGTAETFAKYATAAQKRMYSGSDYTAEFNELGRKMLEKEIELYPESEQYIRPLITRLAR